MKTYSPRVLAFLAKDNSILSRVLTQVQSEKKGKKNSARKSLHARSRRVMG